MISESVLETCSEWLRTCREQDDSDEEDSDYDNEQSRSSSSLANQQDLSLASIAPASDQGQWYNLAEFAGSDSMTTDQWSQPTVDLSSQSTSDLDTTAQALLRSSCTHVEGKRFSLPSPQPDLLLFGGPTSGAPGGWLSSSMDLSGDPSTSWRQIQMLAGTAPTLPESTQDS